MFRLSSLWESIKTTIAWLPVIWRDRDWDYAFFFILLQYKLKRMEKFFRERGHHVGSEKGARRMHVCYLLLGRLIDDMYGEMAFSVHDKRWGKLEIDWDAPIKIWRAKVTPEAAVQERNESQHCHLHEEYLRNQDLVYLFYLFKKHVFKWWD